jgi:hypothetical protein
MREVVLSPAQIRWVLACIRAADNAQVTAQNPIKCDFYESVVSELLSHLYPEPTS